MDKRHASLFDCNVSKKIKRKLVYWYILVVIVTATEVERLLEPTSLRPV